MGPGGANGRGAAEAAPPPFARVAPALFLGSARAAGATEMLTRAGVTLCVNVSRQQPGPRAPGVAELRVPVFDDPAEDLLAHLEPTCAAMEAAVRGGGACLVYCKNGRSRSAAVCTAYLMRHRGLSLERAFQVGTFRRSPGGGTSGGGHTPLGAGPPGRVPTRPAVQRRPCLYFPTLAGGEERPPGSRAQSRFLVSAPELRADAAGPGAPAPEPGRPQQRGATTPLKRSALGSPLSLQRRRRPASLAAGASAPPSSPPH